MTPLADWIREECEKGEYSRWLDYERRFEPRLTVETALERGFRKAIELLKVDDKDGCVTSSYSRTLGRLDGIGWCENKLKEFADGEKE